MSYAVILGGGKGVWDELAQCRSILGMQRGIYAVNDMGEHYPQPLDGLITLHPENLSRWLKGRSDRGLRAPRKVWSHEANPLVSDSLPWQWHGISEPGSSGLYAVKVLTHLGWDRIVLCGVPLEADHNHYFGGGPWVGAEGFRKTWLLILPHIRYTVRSMSGWTREKLGAPTRDWLQTGVGDSPPSPGREGPVP